MKPITFPRPISVAILYHAGTKDDDVDTLKCVRSIKEAFTRLGHTVNDVVVTKDNWRTAAKIPGDVVFNLVEDDQWELYKTVGKYLEKLGRPQVGHDLASFAHVTKKASIKRQMKKHDISTPNFMIVNAKSTRTHHVQYPVIVKPSEQHAGIGISQDSVVRDDAALAKQVQYLFDHFPGEVIIEAFVPGREIHATIIGNGKDTTVLPLCEIGYGEKSADAWNIYSYEAKWDKTSWEYHNARVEAPAKISRALQKKIEALAKKTYTAFGCHDIARMDIRVDKHEHPFVVDVNMNPSLNYYDDEDATLVSVYAMKWTYDQFIETIAAITYKRTLHNNISSNSSKFLS